MVSTDLAEGLRVVGTTQVELQVTSASVLVIRPVPRHAFVYIVVPIVI